MTETPIMFTKLFDSIETYEGEVEVYEGNVEHYNFVYANYS